GLPEQRHGEIAISVDDRLDVRRNFFVEEFPRRASDGAVLFGQILRRENVPGGVVLNQKRSANRLDRRESCSSHFFKSSPECRLRPGRRRRTSSPFHTATR